MENQETQPQEKPTLQGADLTVSDLANLRTIIDIAVKRGTFNAGEISGVGTVYDKLNNFLNSIAQQKPEEKQ